MIVINRKGERLMIRTPKIFSERKGTYNINNKTIELNFIPSLDFSYLFSLCGISSFNATETDGSCFCAFIDNGNKPQILFNSPESFLLDVSDKGITVASSSEKGFSNGIKYLAALAKMHDGNIPCMLINDEPSVEFRAAHFCIFNPNDGTEKEETDPTALKKSILTAALSGYNYVLIEFWGMFPYKKHPYACWKHSYYTREIVEELISYCIDKLHITPIPVQNLTSHAGWSRIASRQHVVLDQRPDLNAMWIPGGWCFATENPDTKAFLKDIMDDLIETFRNPPFFHASCDKCFGFGSTEEDRTKPADDLFVTHLCNLNSYLQSKGVQMIMWGDMIYSSMDALYWKPDPSIADRLPKNILINVWTHNDIGSRWADVDFFESRGYETVYSPFLNKKGAENMIKLCKTKRSKGIVQTTWHKPQTASETMVFSGALLWSETAPSEETVKKFISKL